jgi:hypothetical protein
MKAIVQRISPRDERTFDSAFALHATPNTREPASRGGRSEDGCEAFAPHPFDPNNLKSSLGGPRTSLLWTSQHPTSSTAPESRT